MTTAVLLLQPVDSLVLGERLLCGERLGAEGAEKGPDALVVLPL
jgi:hypothetical protein